MEEPRRNKFSVSDDASSTTGLTGGGAGAVKQSVELTSFSTLSPEPSFSTTFSFLSADVAAADRSAVDNMNEKVTLEVGGETFVTLQSTLSRHKGTLLAKLTKAHTSYDTCSGRHFFDRDPRLFAFIIDFYRSGFVHFPHNLCGPVLKNELTYWQISEEYIAPCCWRAYKDFEDEEKTLQLLDDAFYGHARAMHQEIEAMKGYRGWSKFKKQLWVFLEDPQSSLPAKLWSVVFVVLLLLSVAVVCLETHPLFRVRSKFSFLRNKTAATASNPKLRMYLETDTAPELIIRFIVWPRKLHFFTSIFNIIDILSVTPMFILNIIDVINPHFWFENDLFVAYIFLSFASVFRAIRILKLVKHNRGLQIIFLAIKASCQELFLLFMLMAIGMLIFSTMIYYAEFTGPDFQSIPIGFWWSLITMTTVGYGDLIPSTAIGYCIGSLCAVMGMLGTGLPIPVIANSFYWYYKYARIKEKMEAKRSRRMTLAAESDLPGPTSTLGLSQLPLEPRDVARFPRYAESEKQE